MRTSCARSASCCGTVQGRTRATTSRSSVLGLAVEDSRRCATCDERARATGAGMPVVLGGHATRSEAAEE